MRVKQGYFTLNASLNRCKSVKNFDSRFPSNKSLIALCLGGQAGGRVDGRAREAEGDHRGAGANLRRDVRILVSTFAGY